jgi:hypothetical protein
VPCAKVAMGAAKVSAESIDRDFFIKTEDMVDESR